MTACEVGGPRAGVTFDAMSDTAGAPRARVTLDLMADGEVAQLTELMALAFDAEAPAEPDFDRRLLDCYHTSDFFVRFPPMCLDLEQYTLRVDGAVGGGVVIWRFDDDAAVLGLYFIAPACQGHGIGFTGWSLIEARYPEVRRWTVAAPRWSPRTLRFYERRCGFRVECVTGAYVTLSKERGR